MSLNHIRPWRNIHRRKSRQIMVGNVPVGGDAPITVQTMTNTLTPDVKATIAQVQAAADAGAYLISPFVGRILDWYKNSTGKSSYAADEDPGVLSVTKIFNFYKACGYKTIVMGASFRNLGEIEELAGCDRLTISPELLEALANDEEELPQKLFSSHQADYENNVPTESEFRWALNQDAMATEKLAEGIRKFAEDQVSLENLLREKLPC